VQEVIDSDTMADWIGDSDALPITLVATDAIGCDAVQVDDQGTNRADVWSEEWGDVTTADAQVIAEVNMAGFALASCPAFMDALKQTEADGWQWVVDGQQPWFTGYLPTTELGVGLGQFCYGNVCVMALLPSEATSLEDGFETQFLGRTVDDFMNDLVATVNAVAAGG